MEQQNTSRWGGFVFVMIFVASIFLLLADKAMAR
jgi:preprotein translocase subunit SecE